MKIAMWSGPRNLSTALMYAFDSRDDCTAVDEPFYASYLAHTGIQHPMQEQILASQSTDPGQVIADLIAPHPKSLQYQKHMTHHMDGVSLDWLADFTNVFLIRHPARVIASYAAKRENPTLADLGFVQQLAIYRQCRAMGQAPIVVDSDDILADPPAMLERLCTVLGIAYQPAMVSWAAGPRDCDGVWASHWYDAVHASTGLIPMKRKLPTLESGFEDVLAQAMTVYDEMSAVRISVKG